MTTSYPQNGKFQVSLNIRQLDPKEEMLLSLDPTSERVRDRLIFDVEENSVQQWKIVVKPGGWVLDLIRQDISETMLLGSRDEDETFTVVCVDKKVWMGEVSIQAGTGTNQLVGVYDGGSPDRIRVDLTGTLDDGTTTYSLLDGGPAVTHAHASELSEYGLDGAIAYLELYNKITGYSEAPVVIENCVVDTTDRTRVYICWNQNITFHYHGQLANQLIPTGKLWLVGYHSDYSRFFAKHGGSLQLAMFNPDSDNAYATIFMAKVSPEVLIGY